jgi:hypothetical protein
VRDPEFAVKAAWVLDLYAGTWDGERVRTASAPPVVAALRNLAITILRLAGYASIATRTSPPRPQAGPAPYRRS